MKWKNKAYFNYLLSHQRLSNALPKCINWKMLNALISFVVSQHNETCKDGDTSVKRIS